MESDDGFPERGLALNALLRRLWSVLWRLAALAVLWGVFFSPVVLVLRRPSAGQHPAGDPAEWLLVESIGAVSILLACGLMLRFADRRSLRSLGFDFRHALRDSALGLLLGLGLIVLCVGLLMAGGWAQIALHGDVSATMLLLSGVAILLNAATQEILVRGYLLQTIRNDFGTAAAVLASSLVFAVIHPAAFRGTWLPALNLVLIGLLFAAGYLLTGNLWLSIAIHFGWNWALGSLLGLAVSGLDLSRGWRMMEMSGPEWISGGAFGMEGSLVTTAVVSVSLAVAFRLRPRKP